jgi:topoisomerase IA-like protein
MGDVKISFGDHNRDLAIELLAAAESLGLDQSEVRTTTGAFVVSEEIANEAGYGEKPAKKATAKKATAKKAAKKSTSKKSQE